ncbi:hypothetical protein PHLH8_57130 [Pseudomonas sp. Pc102]|uniref:hypothetical protein n=1 Tax=Pseudomonas sp. Pc102 TaxID=2678261 RepID=UPI001BCE6D8E|nr:hypothetical protein [Pseudomonas sp. Pc102]BBP86071.1 hypothetical protein PHLH8_57130 [Pseudomonas sp. Pc102]
MGFIRYAAPLLCLFTLLPAAFAGQQLRVCQQNPVTYAYRIELANLILARTAERYGAASIAPSNAPDPSQERCLAMLKAGQVDLAYVPPNRERLADFRMLPIDMHQGLLGYRVLIIRKDRQADFARIDELEGLRRMTGGFGSQWSDFPLFARNHLPVLGMANPGNLLPMLEQRRFDYFHRGLSEAWAEVDANRLALPDLVVEQHLALKYPMPVYFTFAHDNRVLERRFAEGFEMIRADGTFQALFLRHHGHLIDKAGMAGRRVIELDSDLPGRLPDGGEGFAEPATARTGDTP